MIWAGLLNSFLTCSSVSHEHQLEAWHARGRLLPLQTLRAAIRRELLLDLADQHMGRPRAR